MELRHGEVQIFFLCPYPLDYSAEEYFRSVHVTQERTNQTADVMDGRLVVNQRISIQHSRLAAGRSRGNLLMLQWWPCIT